jgi:RimJ/RimL family protein N-acetyltransferase
MDPRTQSHTPFRLTPSDAGRYVAPRREMLADSPWASAGSEGDDRGLDAVGLRASLARPEGYAILALAGGPGGAGRGGPLIAAAGAVREEKAKRRHLALIWGVYVAPAHRGRGLGRSLVTAALAVARSWPGVEVAHLTVSEGAPAARRLYESLGFVAWGTEPDALRVEGRSYAETHMLLVL